MIKQKGPKPYHPQHLLQLTDLDVDHNASPTKVLEGVNRVLKGRGIKFEFVEYTTDADYQSFDLEETE